MSSATSGRFGTLLRWLGITLVVLLVLQLLAVLSVSNWGEESFRQLLATTLVTQSPMAFVGMLLMLIGQRLDEPVPGRTPLRWFVAVVSTVLALGLLVTIPVSISGDRAVSDQANQALLAQRGQLEMAKAQLENPQVLEQVIAQGVQAGQISADASEADKGCCIVFAPVERDRFGYVPKYDVIVCLNTGERLRVLLCDFFVSERTHTAPNLEFQLFRVTSLNALCF